MTRALTIYSNDDFELLYTEKHEALKDPYSIVMLEELLKKNNNKFVVAVLHKFFQMFHKSPFFASDNETREFCIEIGNEYTNLNTVRAYILGLKRIFEIGREYRIMSYNPIDRLEKLRFLKIPTMKFTPQEREVNVTKSKIDLLITSDYLSKRSKAIIMFLGNTGCRASELVDLKTKNIIKERNKSFDPTKPVSDDNSTHYYRINLYQRKQNEMRILKLPSTIYEYISKNINKFNNAYDENIESVFVLHNRYGNKMSTQGLQYIISLAWRKLYANDKIAAHQFRHWFITYKLYTEKLPLSLVSKLVGHKNIATTAAYDDRKVSQYDYNTIKVPEETYKPEVIIIDNTNEVLRELERDTKTAIKITRYPKAEIYKTDTIFKKDKDKKDKDIDKIFGISKKTIEEKSELSEDEIMEILGMEIPEEYMRDNIDIDPAYEKEDILKKIEREE